MITDFCRTEKLKPTSYKLRAFLLGRPPENLWTWRTEYLQLGGHRMRLIPGPD